ncbi:hypothetical protein ACFSO7_01120 [Bacillus sp. CGMCC 1.16607]|uniref:hypothetical protein n=1 Tax=Bacillus sp. CGMCC 1.16607 TaxID=3351842 RepID=UPI003638AA11
MKKPFFISFDGPKGVGKSTLLEGVYQHLSKEYTVTKLIEKELDPFRDQVKDILLGKNELNLQLELEVIDLLAKGRAWITQEYIQKANTDFILIDRWYPSDAAFRKLHSFDTCLEINLNYGVAVPNLIIATTCNPEVSMHRATSREDGLRSIVIHDMKDHIESTTRFEIALNKHNWYLTPTDKSKEEVVENVITGIMNRILK